MTCQLALTYHIFSHAKNNIIVGRYIYSWWKELLFNIKIQIFTNFGVFWQKIYLSTYTVSVRSNRTDTTLWSKMPIFKRPYHTLKMLPHLYSTQIFQSLIRALNWGSIKQFSSRGIRMAGGQSLKSLSLLKKKGVFGNF